MVTSVPIKRKEKTFALVRYTEQLNLNRFTPKDLLPWKASFQNDPNDEKRGRKTENWTLCLIKEVFSVKEVYNTNNTELDKKAIDGLVELLNGDCIPIQSKSSPEGVESFLHKAEQFAKLDGHNLADEIVVIGYEVESLKSRLLVFLYLYELFKSLGVELKPEFRLALDKIYPYLVLANNKKEAVKLEMKTAKKLFGSSLVSLIHLGLVHIHAGYAIIPPNGLMVKSTLFN